MGPTLSINNKEDSSSRSKNNKKTKKETIFLFDWDDTLMCTHFINKKNQKLSKEEEAIVQNLGTIVANFLKKSSEYGKVIIMTNSSEIWFKITSKYFLKINDKTFENIKIISTRDQFVNKGIEKGKWKKLALNELLLKYGDNIENLICASDSENDIDIFKEISKGYKQINVSTIKFKYRPTPTIIKKELQYLSRFLYKTIGSKKNYYLIKEKKKNEDFSSLLFYFMEIFSPN